MYSSRASRLQKPTHPSASNDDFCPPLTSPTTSAVITILRGSLRLDDMRSRFDVKPPLITARPPQLIVGMSIGLDGEPEFNDQTPVLPVLIDTGTNKIFSISEYHLSRMASIDKTELNIDKRNPGEPLTGVYQGYKYEGRRATLWLHRSPYKPGDWVPPEKPPLLLARCDRIRIFETKDVIEMVKGVPTKKQMVYPRIPLLGLNALMESNLRLFIDGERSRFRISMSLRTWLND